MVSLGIENKLVGINNFEVTDFSDGMPLKTERIGKCVAVAFYNHGGHLGALPHPIVGTNPERFFRLVRETVSSQGTSAAIIGNGIVQPAKSFIEALAELLGGAGYDVRFRGFDKDYALRDATLYPHGGLEIYRHTNFYSEPEFEKRLYLG